MATTRPTQQPAGDGDRWIALASAVRAGRPVVIWGDDPLGPALLLLQGLVGTPNTPSPTWTEHVVAGAPDLPAAVISRLVEAAWFKDHIGLARRAGFPADSALGLLGSIGLHSRGRNTSRANTRSCPSCVSRCVRDTMIGCLVSRRVVGRVGLRTRAMPDVLGIGIHAVEPVPLPITD